MGVGGLTYIFRIWIPNPPTYEISVQSVNFFGIRHCVWVSGLGLMHMSKNEAIGCHVIKIFTYNTFRCITIFMIDLTLEILPLIGRVEK